MSDIDAGMIRDLAIAARDGAPSATPPIEPTAEAPEMGRRIARALSSAYRDPNADPDEQQAAYVNLVGLAAQGAAYHARRLLQEGRFKITRQGETVSIRGAYSLPRSVATNGHGQTKSDGGDESLPPSNLYVQFDFMTWEMLRTLRDQIQGQHRGLGALLVTIDEILILEMRYPSCSVGEAMDRAGLDRSTLQIDLDKVVRPDSAAGAV